MSKALLSFGIFLLSISIAFASNYRVNPNTRFIIDQYNRSTLFHGVNAIYKLPPYYPPNLNSFDADLSLCETDFQNLQQWGLNFIRLYISWEGTEQVRGQYNATYMEIVQNIVQSAAKYNITVLLDAHQDLASRKLCGEGFPDWAVNRTNFPAPLTAKISYDDQGHANITDCTKVAFSLFYTTDDVRNAFKSLYTNVDGIADSLTSFWQAVANVFKDEPNVLGYEIINEPSMIGILPDGIDKNYLQPIYQQAHQKIRQVDNNTIIFFEPMVADVTKVGFTEGPGGPAYNDRQVLSYHIYCPGVDSSGEPIDPAVCEATDSLLAKGKADAAKNLGVAAFMTEFGAVSQTNKSLDEIGRVTTIADKYLHSWSYWQLKWYDDFTTADKPGSVESFYNVDGSLQQDKVKALARSYAYATCGVPTKQSFDATTGVFSFSYLSTTLCQGQQTELYLNSDFYYPNGFKQEFNGCDQCSVVQLGASSKNYWAINVPQGLAEGTVITLTITPDGRAHV